MLKKLNMLTLSVVIALSLGACSQPNETTNNDSAKNESTDATKTQSTEKQPTEAKPTETSTDQAEVTTLRFSHFLPAPSYLNKEIFEPWAKQIEEASKGKLKIEIYPSAQLTKPPVTYDATAKGTVDIGLQLHGMANGRFPLVEISELPGISHSASQTSCLLQTLYDQGVYDNEYRDTHVLTVFGSGPGLIHTKDKLVEKPDDMKGLRIRRPSAVPGDILASMGASPVGIPPTDMYTSLQRGVIDGVTITWDGFDIFRLGELSSKHTNMPFYVSSMVLTMNQDKYNELPDELKQILDENSGMTLAKKIGTVMDKHWQTAYKAAKDRGDEIVEIEDPLNHPDWSEPLKSGTQKYLDSVKEKGLAAESVYEQTKKAAQDCSL